MVNQSNVATQPPTGQDDGQDPSMDISQGYTIEIRVQGHAVSVCVSPMPADGKDGDQDDSENYQQVKSFGDAMRLARDIYTHAGDMENATSGSMSQMSNGYQE